MRLLWFASHGNIFVRHVEILEPVLDPHTVGQLLLYIRCVINSLWLHKLMIN